MIEYPLSEGDGAVLAVKRKESGIEVARDFHCEERRPAADETPLRVHSLSVERLVCHLCCVQSH